MQLYLTVDTEPDCPPYLDSYRGIEEGLPALLALLKNEHVPATFFITGDVARRYPERIRNIVTAGHEVGCHGDTHQRFDTMDDMQARDEIRNSSETLRQFYPAIAFRAPNLSFPEKFLPLLAEKHYRIDSSRARYKTLSKRNGTYGDLIHATVSTTSSVLRLPRLLRYPLLAQLKEPVILLVHPWEFVDFRRDRRLRLDCRFRTGQKALTALRENIQFFKQRNASFALMKELITFSPPSSPRPSPA